MARKTILVCDMCGAEVEEQKGATMRVTYTDARRGSRQADLCDSCAGKQPGRTVARRGRRPKAAAAVASGDRPPLDRVLPIRRHAPALDWVRAADTACGARERRQGRSPARPLCGGHRARSRAHRAQPPGGRCASGGISLPTERRSSAAGWRRSTTSSRASPGNGDHRPVLTDGQRGLLLRSLARKPHGSPATPRRSAPRSPSSSQGSSSRRISTLSWPSSCAHIAPSSTSWGWDRDRERRYAAERVASELDAWDGPPGLRLRIRRPHRGAVGAHRSTVRASRRHGFAAVRARTARVLRPGANGGNAVPAGGRTDRGAPSRVAPVRAARARPSRAAAVRGWLRADASAHRGRGALPRGRGCTRRARARWRGDPRAHAWRDGSGRDRRRPALARSAGARRSRRRSPGSAFPTPSRGRLRLGQTPFGSALLSLLRFAWLGGGRRDLYAFMRSPYSGLRRDHVDFLEGRLRGRAIHTPERVEEETLKLRGQPLPFLDTLRAGDVQPRSCEARSPRRCSPPPTGWAAHLYRRGSPRPACVRVDAARVEELDAWQALAGRVEAEEIVYALERAYVGGGPAQQPGRVAVLDMLRARTRHYEIVFVLGLEEGTLPQARRPRRRCSTTTPGARSRSGRAARASCGPIPSPPTATSSTRRARAPRGLYLVREAVTDDGSPREPSPFWNDVRTLFASEDVARWTRRRALSEATWPVERAPTERERMRAAAALAATVDAEATTAIARANGWDRRIDRALAAFSRPTRLTLRR